MKNTKVIGLTLALIISLGMTACSSSAGDAESKGESIANSLNTASSLAHPEIADESASITSKAETAAASGTDDVPVTNDIASKELVPEAVKGAEYDFTAHSADTAEGELTPDISPEFYYDDVYKPDAEADRDAGDVIYEEPFVSGDEIAPVPPVSPEVGMLTAGEWNDNNNWGFFTNLVTTDKISFPSYGIDPRFRTKVTVTDKSEKQPVINAKVSIYDDANELLWTAVTDKNGTAYLFTDDPSVEFKGIVEYGDAKTEFTSSTGTSVQSSSDNHQGTAKTASSEFELELDSKGKNYKNTDIMFIVDATGSMSDEMMFLQKEFTDITDKVGDQGTRYSINFYRDDGDDYVTKCSDFTDDVSAMQEKLNGEFAEGGGDIPEAVDKILDECINSTGWSAESVKLVFMIFDAPPHIGKEESLKASIKTAAEKGIRIIPVIASNSERDTELFGRAVAIKTGGTYVFLTDDSGIGESHLEPIIGKYDVEKLNDLIIRVINSYKQ